MNEKKEKNCCHFSDDLVFTCNPMQNDMEVNYLTSKVDETRYVKCIDSPLKRERPHDVYFKYNEARV